MAERAGASPRDRRLVVMVKLAAAGRVKTRLAKGIGAGRAAAIYRQMTASLLREVGSDPRWQTWLAIAPDRAVGSPTWPDGPLRVAQGGGDLGERMRRLVDGLPAGPIVIIGTDVPAIRRHHIAVAFRRLADHDAVFGPASDGGYWLVGLARRRVVPGLFADVRWSGPHALADSLRPFAGARVAFLQELDDIDTAEDWRAHQRNSGRSRQGPHGKAARVAVRTR